MTEQARSPQRWWREERSARNFDGHANETGRPVLRLKSASLKHHEPHKKDPSSAAAEAEPDRLKEETEKLLAMPDLGSHATLLLAEFPTAFASFLNTHTLHFSCRVRSHPLPKGANLAKKTS
jgi:predicted alpha/beta superfamily hydrolase